MGAVYRAEQTRLGRAVAVKVLPPLLAPDPEALERFEREARILSELNHPHVLHIHDFGSLEDGTLYIVTEWAIGGDLRKVLDGKAHSLEQVQDWVRQICEALTETHGQGIIHRDLKPGNVLVFADGRLSLADFGLAQAKSVGSTAPLTNHGALFGTFEYMAPEQMDPAGNVTPAADLYALAVMTYQMITGRVPHCSYTRPSRIVNVPPEVDEFLDAALAHEVERRPASAAEFYRLFELACNAPRRRRRRRRINTVAVLVLLALIWSRAEVIMADRRLANLWASLEAPADPPPPVPVIAPAAEPPAQLNSAPLSIPESEFDAVFEVEPGVTPEVKAQAVPTVPWTWVLTDLKPETQARAGDWHVAQNGLVSGGGACALSLPVPASTRYDIAIEFTRIAAGNSVVLFLPTASGPGTLEVDAWRAGTAGLQLMDGAELHRHQESFLERIRNGQKNRLIVQVRDAQMTANWNGETRITWDLKGRKLSLPAFWPLRADIGLGVGTWESSTLFHRIAYRIIPAEGSP
jgi:hypothetical protein